MFATPVTASTTRRKRDLRDKKIGLFPSQFSLALLFNSILDEIANVQRRFFGSRQDYLLITIVFIWITLAAVFGIFDLNISLSVVDGNSIWGDFGDRFGELPGHGLVSIAVATLIGGYARDLKKQRIPGYITMAIGIIYAVYASIRNDNNGILIGVFLATPMAAFALLTKNIDWRIFRPIFAIVSLLALLNPLLFVQTSKLLIGRVRFSDLALDYGNFTPWYIPQGATGNYSFPSGHTSMGFMFLPLLNLVRELRWKDIRKILMIVLVVGWGLFVGLSRVVVGAHYASDVLFPTGVAAITTILLSARFSCSSLALLADLHQAIKS